MQLRQVRLTNIRSYESADLALGPGTTLLVGDVGAGKTSLLFAIEMALFGFAEVDPTFLVRHRAGESAVALTLEGDGHRYEFRRRFRRRTRRGKELFELESSTYSEDGATTEYSATEIRQRAITLLGFPDNQNPRAHSDLWRWAVYVPQERMREVLAQDPQVRLETVRKALGLEQYRTAAENAQLVAAELRRMAERADAEASGRDHWVERHPALRAELEERGREVARLDEELERRRADLRAAEALAAEREADESRRSRDRVEEDQLAERRRSEEERALRLEARLKTLNAETRRLLQEEASARDLVARRTDAEGARGRLEAQITDLRRRQDSARQWTTERSALDAQRRTLRGAMDHATEEVERAETEARATTDELRRLRADGPQREPPAPTPRSLTDIDGALAAADASVRAAVNIEGRLQHVTADIEELRSQGVCPRCHQSVDVARFGEHLEQARRDLTEQRERTAQASALVTGLQEERRSRERYERSLQRWRDLETSRSAAASTVQRAERRLAAARERHAAVTRETGALLARFNELEPRAREAAAIDQELSTAESERAALERALREMSDRWEAARMAGASRARLEDERGRGEQELAQLRATVEEIGARLREVRSRLDGSATAATALAAARERVDGARDAERRTLSERARAGSQAESIMHQIGEAERQLSERERSVKLAVERRAAAQWIGSTFRESVLTLEHRLLARAQDEFERHFARYFALLVEDPSLTARCDTGFSPAVEIDGEWTPAEALSGGERTALALAFRLALGGVVRAAGRLQLDTLILDEPTDGFSPEQVLKMGELLEGLGIPQVILVSHENALTSIADHVVRVSKSGGRSELRSETGEVVGTPSGPTLPPRAGRRRGHTPRLDAPSPAAN